MTFLWNPHDTIQRLNCIVHYLNTKIKGTWVEIIKLKLGVHSNEMPCRKMGRLGLEPVTLHVNSHPKFSSGNHTLILWIMGCQLFRN